MTRKFFILKIFFDKMQQPQPINGQKRTFEQSSGGSAFVSTAATISSDADGPQQKRQKVDQAHQQQQAPQGQQPYVDLTNEEIVAQYQQRLKQQQAYQYSLFQPSIFEPHLKSLSKEQLIYMIMQLLKFNSGTNILANQILHLFSQPEFQASVYCRRCKKQFRELNNYDGACVYHTGALRRKEDEDIEADTSSKITPQTHPELYQVKNQKNLKKSSTHRNNAIIITHTYMYIREYICLLHVIMR